MKKKILGSFPAVFLGVSLFAQEVIPRSIITGAFAGVLGGEQPGGRAALMKDALVLRSAEIDENRTRGYSFAGTGINAYSETMSFLRLLAGKAIAIPVKGT
ncbi:MAG: hypothetical protein LBB48_03535 [Treponema sp.]|jgi:hypothetical protein|nr:hypothetical protein [Treponema sp.]